MRSAPGAFAQFCLLWAHNQQKAEEHASGVIEDQGTPNQLKASLLERPLPTGLRSQRPLP